MPVKLVSLEATDEALAKRFNEMGGPPAGPRCPFSRAGWERRRLQPIRLLADEVVETSGPNIYQLKDVIAERILRREGWPRTQVVLTSFAISTACRPKSDIVFDTPVPAEPVLMSTGSGTVTGKARERPQVRPWNRRGTCGRSSVTLFGCVDFELPRFAREGKDDRGHAVGCTGASTAPSSSPRS